MTDFEVKNSTDTPIKFSYKKGDKVQDVILYAQESRHMPVLAGSHIDFINPVDISFRQKNVSKLSLFKTTKEDQQKVKALDIPDSFVSLKIKKIHGDKK